MRTTLRIQVDQVAHGEGEPEEAAAQREPRRRARARQEARGPAPTLETRMTALEHQMSSLHTDVSALRTEIRFGRQRDDYNYETQHAFQYYMSSHLGRQEPPPPFEYSPYNHSHETAYYAAQRGGSTAGTSSFDAGVPEIVRDAEEKEMDE